MTDRTKIPLNPIAITLLIVGGMFFFVSSAALLSGVNNPLLLFPLFISFVVLGIAAYLFYSRSKIFKLLDTGNVVEAKVTEVYKNFLYVRGAELLGLSSGSWNIVAKNRNKTFYQYGVFAKLSLQKNQTVKVYVDPEDPFNYFVDYTPFVK